MEVILNAKIYWITLNLYKIPAKEHQVVGHVAADQISISEILFWKYSECLPITLRNYKKLKRRQIVRFTIFSFLSAQHALVTTAETFSEKRRTVPLI